LNGAAIVLVLTDDGGRRVANLNTRKEKPKEMPDSVMRKHLDAGVAKQLIAKYRALNPGENTTEYHCYGEYMNIILAAYMMMLGANIDQEFNEYLRALVPTVWPSSLRSHSLLLKSLSRRSQAATVSK
jgi:hypothetical protein